MKKKSCFAVFIIISLSLSACLECDSPAEGENSTLGGGNSGNSHSTGSGPAPMEPHSEGVFNATFTEATVYFESMDDVISMDEVKQVYQFKKASQKAQELKPGSILLLHGKALRKVAKVLEEGNAIVVETGDATLDELIKDGTIEWTTAVNFGSVLRSKSLVKMQIGNQLYQPTSQTESGASFDIKIGDYRYVVSLEAAGDSMNAKLEVERFIGSTVAGRFKAEGNISGFSSSNQIEYSNSRLTNFSNKNKNLKGDLTLSQTAIGPWQDKLTMEFPFPLITIPAMVGPLPVFLNIKWLVAASAILPVAGSVDTTVRFKYDTEAGFSYDGTEVTAEGDVGSYLADIDKGNVGGGSMVIVDYAMAFPRLEIGMFGNTVGPWVQTGFGIYNYWKPFLPTCRQTAMSYFGAVGYELKFFGVKMMSGSKDLWRIDKPLEEIGDCPEFE